jgi:hypothetical protein
MFTLIATIITHNKTESQSRFIIFFKDCNPEFGNRILELATGSPYDKTPKAPLSAQLPTAPDQSANMLRQIWHL